MLKPIQPLEFLANVRELMNYVSASKKVPVITNTSRLINILHVYFRTLLFYLSNRNDDNSIRVGSHDYKLEFDLTDSVGRTQLANFEDVGGNLIRMVFEDFSKTLSEASFANLLDVVSEILNTGEIPLSYKLSIIDLESKISPDNWRKLITTMPYGLATRSINERKVIIKHVLGAKSLEEVDLQNEDLDLSLVNNSYLVIVNMASEVYVRYNKFIDIFSYLTEEIEYIGSISSDTLWDRPKVLFELFRELISYNHLFTVIEWDFLTDSLAKHEKDILGSSLATLKEYISLDLTTFALRKFSLHREHPDFGIDQSMINTNIYFVVNHSYLGGQDHINGSTQRHIGEEVSVGFSPISNLFQDPVFSFMTDHHIPWEKRHINGIPWAVLADSLGNLNRSTLIKISIKGIYAPDFEIIDGKVVYYDFDLEERQRGQDYYPHKDRIVEVLYNLHSRNDLPLDIKLDDINSGLISNYYVEYLSRAGIIHQQIFSITNLDSYQKIKNRYIGAINSLQIETGEENIREFLFNYRINSRRTFHEFCIALIERTCQASIEFGNLWRPLWEGTGENMEPVKEIKSQPIIDSTLTFLCEMKGVVLVREPLAADGHIDFYMAYSHEGNVLSVGIELKNAHSNKLNRGMQSQLPLYLKGLRTRRGIYLVLWFKGTNFSEPNGFSDRGEMIAYLNGIRPGAADIRVLAIDASIKTPPSIAEASTRIDT